MVSTEDLPTALSQNQARQHVASLLGGPLGGALYAVTRWLPFAVDALSFAVACVTVSRVRTDLSRAAPPPRAAAPPAHRGIRASCGQRPFFRTLMVWASLTNLVINALFFVVVLRMVQDGRARRADRAGLDRRRRRRMLGAAMAPSLIHRLPTGG